MKTVVIIQARMGSTRLPGKVLANLAGQPMLKWVVDRVRLARTPDAVIVAIPKGKSDRPLLEFCKDYGVEVFTGSENDVLDRYGQAARFAGAEFIVRVTSDCPLLDPELLDDVVRALQEGNLDFTANRLPPPWTRTYPIGLDVEACTFQALMNAVEEADLPHQRTHVMPFFYENQSRFRCRIIEPKTNYGFHRWTVDTEDDLQAVGKICTHFRGRNYGWKDVLAFVDLHPEISRLNQNVHAKHIRDS